ncbi:MAG: DUF1150 family protein [Pseudomonadota bacterium]
MNGIERIRQMSPADLAVLGLEQVAYTRPVVVDGQPGFAVHSADGTTLGIAPSRELARIFIRDQDLELVSLH